MVAGYGLAAVIWNPVQLLIANPNDVEAAADGDSGADGDKYFVSADVLDRVPTLLYSLSAVYAAALSLGVLLVGEGVEMMEEIDEGDDGSDTKCEKGCNHIERG